MENRLKGIKKVSRGKEKMFCMIRHLQDLSPFSTWRICSREQKKVGTVPTCSRRIFSPTNFNQSRCRILVFASRRANKFAKWKTGFSPLKVTEL